MFTAVLNSQLGYVILIDDSLMEHFISLLIL